MADKKVSARLNALTDRSDIPEDVKSIISQTIDDLGRPLETDLWIYRVVVIVLGITVLSTVLGGIILTLVGKGDQAVTLPDAIVAIGSAAVGALAGLLAPPPRGD